MWFYRDNTRKTCSVSATCFPPVFSTSCLVVLWVTVRQYVADRLCCPYHTLDVRSHSSSKRSLHTILHESLPLFSLEPILDTVSPTTEVVLQRAQSCSPGSVLKQ
ncbi:unnamed protein product, partial [Sphacelaria rigidula]